MAHRIWLLVRLSGEVIAGCEIVPANVVLGRRGVELVRPPWAQQVLARTAGLSRFPERVDIEDLPVLEPVDADDQDVLPPVDGDWSQALLETVERSNSAGMSQDAVSAIAPGAAGILGRSAVEAGLPLVIPVGDLGRVSLQELDVILERSASVVFREDRDVVLVAGDAELVKVPWIVGVPTRSREAVAVVLVAARSDA